MSSPLRLYPNRNFHSSKDNLFIIALILLRCWGRRKYPWSKFINFSQGASSTDWKVSGLMKDKIHSTSHRNYVVNIRHCSKNPSGSWAHLNLIKMDTALCSPGYTGPTIGRMLHNGTLAWRRVLIDRSCVGSMRSLVYILRRKPGILPWKTAAFVKGLAHKWN